MAASVGAGPGAGEGEGDGQRGDRDISCTGDNDVGAVKNSGDARSDDSDFDDLLASYLDGVDIEDNGSGSGGGGGGIFGKAGGSLLVPLGALRLLRYGMCVVSFS